MKVEKGYVEYAHNLFIREPVLKMLPEIKTEQDLLTAYRSEKISLSDLNDISRYLNHGFSDTLGIDVNSIIRCCDWIRSK